MILIAQAEYDEYIGSEQWKDKREQVLIFWDYSCALCSSADALEVHHRTYRRFRHERLTDLIALCHRCHAIHHERLPKPGLYWLEKAMRVCNG